MDRETRHFLVDVGEHGDTFTDRDFEPCVVCGHPCGEHDGMGDCHHPDGRTRTGLCNKHDYRGN